MNRLLTLAITVSYFGTCQLAAEPISPSLYHDVMKLYRLYRKAERLDKLSKKFTKVHTLLKDSIDMEIDEELLVSIVHEIEKHQLRAPELQKDTN